MYEEEFIISLWVIAALFLWVLKLKWSNRKLRRGLAAPAPVAEPPAPALLQQPSPERDHEMNRLRDRVAVLERITVEKESTLSREIDSLRHR